MPGPVIFNCTRLHSNFKPNNYRKDSHYDLASLAWVLQTFSKEFFWNKMNSRERERKLTSLSHERE